MQSQKEWVQERAEYIARDAYDMEFHELAKGAARYIYSLATDDYRDYISDQIDYIYERERDRRMFEGRGE